jgi:hypothetical protein
MLNEKSDKLIRLIADFPYWGKSASMMMQNKYVVFDHFFSFASGLMKHPSTCPFTCTLSPHTLYLPVSTPYSSARSSLRGITPVCLGMASSPTSLVAFKAGTQIMMFTLFASILTAQGVLV